jgi:hypothetical protein
MSFDTPDRCDRDGFTPQTGAWGWLEAPGAPKKHDRRGQWGLRRQQQRANNGENVDPQEVVAAERARRALDFTNVMQMD